jgi:DNA polymerase iota
MFRRLHPEKQGWNLSLMNIGVTNMAKSASEDGAGGGRDIGRMFKRQEDVLKDFKTEDVDVPPDPVSEKKIASGDESHDGFQPELRVSDEAADEIMAGSEDVIPPTQNTVDENGDWEEEQDEDAGCEKCGMCGAVMPAFAMASHDRYHNLEDG